MAKKTIYDYVILVVAALGHNTKHVFFIEKVGLVKISTNGPCEVIS